MNTTLRDRILDYGRQSHRSLLLATGLLAFAAALVGVWYTLPPSEIAAVSQAVPGAGVSRKFALTPFPKPHSVADVAFQDGAGRKLALTDFKGKVVLLNVWATWCSPCRKEMPTLDRLQSRLGGKDFEVVALSIDRDGPGVVREFFQEIGVRKLALYVDPTMEAQSRLEIIGVPTTLLIDREGREVARYTGVAEWDRPEVIDTIEHYTDKHN